MPLTHISRTGKTYYLHHGAKRGGGVQYFFSRKSEGQLADQLPDGFEVYETVNGQVYLRRHQPRLISDDELECIRRRVEQPRQGLRYQVEVLGKVMTVHESSNDFGFMREWAPRLSTGACEHLNERFAHYQPVLRLILVDANRRLFAPERFCFRGSVDDWISIGPPDSITKLAAKYLKHLGSDELYELF